MNETSLTTANKTAWGGLLRRKEVWALSWQGWALLAMTGLAVFMALMVCIHPFLAITERAKPDVLVIEGWLPEYALLGGWHEFQEGHYTTLLTVGEPFLEGPNLAPDDNYGDLGASKMRKLLGSSIPVQPVRCSLVKRDRTYTCAITIKSWLAQHHIAAASVTVVTMDAHARRSRLLYEKVFAPETPVGIVALPDREYDPSRWWRYSEGVRTIISESTAYLYVRFFFHPTE